MYIYDSIKEKSQIQNCEKATKSICMLYNLIELLDPTMKFTCYHMKIYIFTFP